MSKCFWMAAACDFMLADYVGPAATGGIALALVAGAVMAGEWEQRRLVRKLREELAAGR